MLFGFKESDPLVPPTMSSSNEIIYSPLDEHSRNVQRRRRWMKWGGITLIVTAAVLAVVSSTMIRFLWSTSPTVAGIPVAVQVDHLFAGLLADDEAFYFPTSRQEGEETRRRRSLRALAAADPVSWSYDWQSNAKTAAAIGEYYRAKGLAMADYYRSKYDPTYMAAPAADETPDDTAKGAVGSTSSSPDGPPSDVSAWTYDWQADKTRGIALATKYKAIGDAIEAHYREAFDPTYVPSGGSAGGRRLSAVDGAAAAVTKTTTWQDDRDRGIAIGQHYKAMGHAIAEHYKQEFNPMYKKDAASTTATTSSSPYDQDWANMWKDYKSKGLEIAKYYKSKGDAIEQFYAGKYSLEGMAAPMDDEANTGGEVDETPSDGNDASDAADPDSTAAGTYIWGLDWKNDREHAIAIHKEMMAKGLAIGDYYRARYDPTYDASSGGAPTDVVEKARAIKTKDAGEKSVAAVPHHPDLDFPPWGQDPDADRQHGIALGEYWRDQRMAMSQPYKEDGKAIGKMYEKRGKELGKYYEDMFRSKFDPTYHQTVVDTDANV